MKDDRSSRQPPMQQGSSDDFQTPPKALWPLMPFLDTNWTIWECANGEGNLTEFLQEQGYTVIATDLHKTGHDFLKWQPKQEYDCVITNPPYSLKQEFLERCYDLGKPFALLLPLTTFETWKRQRLFKSHGVEVIFFDKRINFHTPSGEGGGSWFATAWFTWGLELPSVLNFVRLEHPDQAKLTIF